MTVQELRSRLALILSEEEDSDVNWTRVTELSLDLYQELRRNPPPDYPADIVDEFLSEFSRRRDDAAYAAEQRTRLLAFLRTN